MCPFWVSWRAATRSREMLSVSARGGSCSANWGQCGLSKIPFCGLGPWLSLALLVACMESHFRQLFCLKHELKKMG